MLKIFYNILKIKQLFLLLFLLLFFSKTGYSKDYQVITEKFITENIQLQKIRYENYSLDYLLIIDSSNVTFDIGFANERKFDSLDFVKNISKSNNAIAAVNLSFFGYVHNKFQDGDIRGFCINDGKVLSSRSIWDKWLKNILIYTEKKQLKFKTLDKSNYIFLKNKNENITTNLSINISHWGGGENYTLFFNKCGDHYISNYLAPFYILKGNSSISLKDKNKYKILSKKNEYNSKASNSPVICFSKFPINSFQVNAEIEIVTVFDSEVKYSIFSVSVGRIIIKNGDIENIPKRYDNPENKTFVAYNDNKNMILGCGEIKSSALADILLKLGMSDAILLDGGGSSCLNVKGENVFGGKRKVANALLIKEYNA